MSQKCDYYETAGPKAPFCLVEPEKNPYKEGGERAPCGGNKENCPLSEEFKKLYVNKGF